MQTYIYDRNKNILKNITESFKNLLKNQYGIDYNQFSDRYFRDNDRDIITEVINEKDNIYQVYALDYVEENKILERFN